MFGLGIVNSFNEKLIELVGKHKILYDNTAEGYSNFQLQDEIWRKIANELNEDVSACKLKWKNIRSCYTRYLRQAASQNGKTSKTYYLAKYLTFLLPFCKPRGHTPNDPSSEEKSPFHYEEQETVGKVEPLDDDTTDADLDENSIQLEEDYEETNVNNKRKTCETNENEFKKSKTIENSDESDLNFFRSLLPDIRKMDGKQKNKLKIAILSAIDTILYGNN